MRAISPFNKDFFKKHQSKLLWFVNTWIGRKVLYLDKKASSVGKNKIIEIAPNAITWKIGEHFTTEFRVRNKYALYPIWYLFHIWDTLFANNKLQAYNQNTTTWDDIDSDNATGVDTNFDLEATVGDLTNYKNSSNVVSFRVWQQAI